jgi:hypothetical protein
LFLVVLEKNTHSEELLLFEVATSLPIRSVVEEEGKRRERRERILYAAPCKVNVNK